MAGSKTFVCVWCKKSYPMSESVPKGNGLVCTKDNTTYVILTTRWAKNPRLKAWWQAKSPEEKPW